MEEHICGNVLLDKLKPFYLINKEAPLLNLMAILYVGSNEGCSVTDIADKLLVDTSTASRIIARLSSDPYCMIETNYHKNNILLRVEEYWVAMDSTCP